MDSFAFAFSYLLFSTSRSLFRGMGAGLVWSYVLKWNVRKGVPPQDTADERVPTERHLSPVESFNGEVCFV
jgi:hypothetical protein